MVILLFLLNTLVAVYYAKKRWYMASITFVLSSTVLFCTSTFMTRIPVATDSLISLIGVGSYAMIQDLLLTYSAYALSPYLAIISIFVIATIVVTIETAATLIDSIKRVKPQRVALAPRVYLRLHSLFYFKKRKTYLSFCTMLC